MQLYFLKIKRGMERRGKEENGISLPSAIN